MSLDVVSEKPHATSTDLTDNLNSEDINLAENLKSSGPVILDYGPSPLQEWDDSYINLKTSKKGSRRWCCTIHDFTHEMIMEFIKMYPRSIIGKEIGKKTKRLHLQCYFETKHQVKWSTMKNKLRQFNNANFGAARKCRLANVRYCSKEHVEYIFEEWRGTVVTGVTDPLEGKTLFPWQEKVVDIAMDRINGNIDDRKIYWIQSAKGGFGKSKLLFHLRCRLGLDVMHIDGAAKDMKTALAERNEKKLQMPKIICMDLPRAREHVSMVGLESIKNGYFCSEKYHTSEVLMEPPTIIIMSNMVPPYTMASYDRWIHMIIKSDLNLYNKPVPEHYRRMEDDAQARLDELDIPLWTLKRTRDEVEDGDVSDGRGGGVPPGPPP